MQYKIKELAPVIFTGNAGGGPGEFAASNNPNVPAHHTLNPGVPSGADIVGVWYSPYHNIGALAAFGMIEVKRQNSHHVQLKIGGVPGSNQRLRIKVTVLYRV